MAGPDTTNAAHSTLQGWTEDSVIGKSSMPIAIARLPAVLRDPTYGVEQYRDGIKRQALLVRFARSDLRRTRPVQPLDRRSPGPKGTGGRLV